LLEVSAGITTMLQQIILQFDFRCPMVIMVKLIGAGDNRALSINCLENIGIDGLIPLFANKSAIDGPNVLMPSCFARNFFSFLAIHSLHFHRPRAVLKSVCGDVNNAEEVRHMGVRQE
jgi:hypothetical protein